MVPTQLGRVDSLFAHVKEDWWKSAFDKIYLWTDGDRVEDPAITETECDSLVQIPSVRELLQGPRSPTSPTQVLDLCCGQGRHSITLAKRYPFVQFHGLDQSSFLLGIAEERALLENVGGNTHFEQGDSRQIPKLDNEFDIVILLGNSFGYGSREEDRQLLTEVHRVLKPGGLFVIDYTDGEQMRANLNESGWEWIKTNPTRKSLLSLRERELSPDSKCLANREIVVDLDGPIIHQDLFYSVQLYDLEEMDALLARAGLSMQPQDNVEVTLSREQGVMDLGNMMERRQLVVSQKPLEISPGTLDPQDADTYIHPHLIQSYDPRKGRQLRVSEPVTAGTVLFADAPYALIPTVNPMSDDALLCSNLSCRRRVLHDTCIRCPINCIHDVVWCNTRCCTTDQARHQFECAWLKEYGTAIRHNEGEYDFGMLWIIMRMLAAQQLESQSTYIQQYPWDDRFERGWKAIDDLRGNQEPWPEAKIQHWKYLIDRYLRKHLDLSDPNALLGLICKEEANAFGLYPGVTGVPTWKARGEQYGLGCYPRATISNHSCRPNVKHGPDARGRMVGTTIRDLAANEECLIAYFDLSVHVDLTARQRMTQELFTFSCDCQRCESEATGH